MMRISLEVEVPEEYVELLMREKNLTRDEAAELLKKFLQQVISRMWDKAVHQLPLYVSRIRLSVHIYNK
jgi:hypothetical protein